MFAWNVAIWLQLSKLLQKSNITAVTVDLQWIPMKLTPVTCPSKIGWIGGFLAGEVHSWMKQGNDGRAWRTFSHARKGIWSLNCRTCPTMICVTRSIENNPLSALSWPCGESRWRPCQGLEWKMLLVPSGRSLIWTVVTPLADSLAWKSRKNLSVQT